MQKIVERDVVTTCAQGKRELDICKSRETFNFGSITLLAPLLLSLSTKGVAQPALKNKVLGNRLIMRRRLHVRLTFVKWRFTATFTLPLLYASRILSDASEFANRPIRGEKTALADRSGFGSISISIEDRRQTSICHCFFSHGWRELFPLSGRGTDNATVSEDSKEAINYRDNKEWGAWSNRWRDPSKGK